MSVVSTNPSNYFGGSWEQIKDRFLLACGNSYSIGATGGEANHVLTINEMPSHRHMPTDAGNYFTYQIWLGSYNVDPSTGGAGSWNGGYTQTTSAVGGNQPHNNMPPYFTCYMWRRIS